MSFGITTWKEFIDIAITYGFNCGFCQKFVGSLSDKSFEEEEIIFFHQEKGLILHAESFEGSRVNRAEVYGEVLMDEENSYLLESLIGCNQYIENANGTISFSVDVRYGIYSQIDTISENFVFSKSWSKVPFLSFHNYMDIKDENYSYEKINKQKIASCTPEVRTIIFG